PASRRYSFIRASAACCSGVAGTAVSALAGGTVLLPSANSSTRNASNAPGPLFFSLFTPSRGQKPCQHQPSPNQTTQHSTLNTQHLTLASARLWVEGVAQAVADEAE